MFIVVYLWCCPVGVYKLVVFSGLLELLGSGVMLNKYLAVGDSRFTGMMLPGKGVRM
jgi:hypothetical protein